MQSRIAGRSLRHVFLRDMVLPASIGIYPHEQSAPQRIRVNIDLSVPESADAGVGRDELNRVVNYERVAQSVRRIVGAGHVMLVETLAERIAEACLTDQRVSVARVRVGKAGRVRRCGSGGRRNRAMVRKLSTRGH